MSLQHLGSSWLHALLLATASLTAWLSLGFLDAPISGDQAYFTYMGQALVRGEPLYATTFLGYTPLGPLISAASMIVGSGFGLPTYLAPRFLAVAIGVLSVLLVYRVVRHTTGAGWAGLLAGLALAGVQTLGASYLSTLQPKHLVVLFTLLAAVACQRRSWGLTGLAAGLATSSYQPALLVPIAFGLVAAWTGARSGARTSTRFGVGLVVGLLPIPLYLAATNGWGDFWVRAIEAPAVERLATAGSAPMHWIQVLIRSYTADLPMFAAAALGWVVFSLQCVLPGGGGRRASRAVDAWLAPEYAGMPALTAVFCISATAEFQGHPDAYPLLPMMAFWAAWTAHRAVGFASAALSLNHPSIAHRSRVALAGLLVLATTILAFRDVAGYTRHYTLADQLEMLERFSGPSESDVVAFFAEEVYALGERRSPYPYLRMPGMILPFLSGLGLPDCRDVALQIRDDRVPVVVLRIRPHGGCEPVIGNLLSGAGYGKSERLGLVVYSTRGL